MATVSSINASTVTDFSAIQKQVQDIQNTIASWQGALSSATAALSSSTTAPSTSSAASTTTSSTTTPDASSLDKIASDIESIAAQVSAYRLANPAVAKALAATTATNTATVAATNPAKDMTVDTLKFNEKGVRIDSGMVDLIGSTAKSFGMTSLDFDKLINPETYQYRQNLYA